jgi:isopenicillin N synthase-like dioxygenase
VLAVIVLDDANNLARRGGLLQDEVGGLQVRNGEGRWVDAPPLQGALVVNFGEMLQLASGGFYLATEHRVLPPPAHGPARLSVPYFFNPNLEAQVRVNNAAYSCRTICVPRSN